MEKDHLKRRIVGAIVLVALGVIFIPMILSGDKDAGGIWRSNIPDKPKDLQDLAQKPMPAMPLAPATPATAPVIVDAATKPVPADTNPAKESKPETLSGQTAAATPAEPAQSATASNVTRAWVVQVGSFSQQANALALQEKLRKKKFPAFVDAVKSGQSTSYRVQVGPHVRKADAEAQAETLAKQLKTKVVVLPHS